MCTYPKQPKGKESPSPCKYILAEEQKRRKCATSIRQDWSASTMSQNWASGAISPLPCQAVATRRRTPPLPPTFLALHSLSALSMTLLDESKKSKQLRGCRLHHHNREERSRTPLWANCKPPPHSKNMTLLLRVSLYLCVCVCVCVTHFQSLRKTK